MTNETQSAEPTVEAATTTATSPANPKVELIPLPLHLQAMELQGRLGQLALDCARILHQRLHVHSPKSPAFKEVGNIMARSRIIMHDLQQIDAAIDAARRAANQMLYGTAEPNAPVEAATEPATEAQIESGATNDSTERASA